MTKKDYDKARDELRGHVRWLRDEAGRRLITAMKSAWNRGATEFVIPPGTYNIYEPVPIGDCCSVDGSEAILCIGVPDFFAAYPPAPPSYGSSRIKHIVW